MKKDYTVALHNEEFDHANELAARGRMRRYFGGRPKWSERESFGIVFGAFLCFAFSFLVPVLLGRSGFDPDGILWTSRFLVAGGVVILLKGFYDIRKDSKKVVAAVTDAHCDACFAFDMKGIVQKAKKVLAENIERLREGDEDIDGLEITVVAGPEDRTANVNLPLLMVVGDDGFIRASNYAVLVIAFGKQDLYIYQCVYNMKDGSAKREHAYRCPHGNFDKAEIRSAQRKVMVADNRSQMHQLLEFTIHTLEGDETELAIPVADLTVEQQSGGKFDLTGAEGALEKLMRIRGCSPVPRRSTEIV